ncbi:MAG: thymidine phosphorylase [Geminicoccaceae bacterium]
MILPQEIIRKKRDGGTLCAGEIAAFIDGLTGERISEGQAAAFAMAVFFNGMSREETIALTRAMTESGNRLVWSGLDGPVVDKHSTGGVGDKVSLILAPVVAACGAYVPMISGRGLGHTGGTLDKLDSIPGYDTAPDLDRLRRAVRAAGCAIIGQTEELAPADRRLYAIRDVTATVESTPLIVASILSKKLAAGLDALVMDVKIGSGAFLPSLEAARALAQDLVEVAEGAGLPCSALLTDMNQCLGRTAGNALEVREAIEVLSGRAVEAGLREVTLGLAAELLVLAGAIAEKTAAAVAVARALASGAAAERFARMVAALGGPGDLLEKPDRHLPQAPVREAIFLEQAGVVATVDARALGLAVVALGGGRRRAADAIDPAVGLSEVRGIGETVGPDAPFAVVHAATASDAAAAAETLRRAVGVVDAAEDAAPAKIVERIASMANGLDAARPQAHVL